MKYYIAAQIIIYCFLFSAVSAQNEQWDTYMAKFGDRPGSVLVDMGLITDAPDRKYPNLVITGPQAHNCDKQGIPAKDEIESLEGILDATSNFLTGITPKILAGTFTYKCERLNYYYVKDTVGIRNAIRRMYDRGYKDYSYSISIKPDPGWITYRTFLYPNEDTRNWMENDKVMAAMLQQGDSLTKQRDINFNLTFGSDTDRRSFADIEIAKGYKAAKFIDPKIPQGTYALILSKFGYIKMEPINAMTDELKREVKKHHGYFNGWSAPLQNSK